MKKILLLFFIAQTAFGQNIAKTDTGDLKGVGYRILFPDNWKGKLVMYSSSLSPLYRSLS